MTQLKGWSRTDNRDGSVVWKHDTGVRIILEREGDGYQLMLIDRHGIEDSECRIWDTNKSELEKISTKWQESYNRHLMDLGIL